MRLFKNPTITVVTINKIEFYLEIYCPVVMGLDQHFLIQIGLHWHLSLLVALIILIVYSSNSSLSEIKGWRSFNKKCNDDSFLDWKGHNWVFTDALIFCTHSSSDHNTALANWDIFKWPNQYISLHLKGKQSCAIFFEYFETYSPYQKLGCTCMHVWMEYNYFKVFKCVLWWFTTKFAPLTRVFRCGTCKQGRHTWKRVDTLESWPTVCLIFGRAVINQANNLYPLQ